MHLNCDPGCAEWAKAFDDCVCSNKVILSPENSFQLVAAYFTHIVADIYLLAGRSVIHFRHSFRHLLRELLSSTNHTKLCPWQF